LPSGDDVDIVLDGLSDCETTFPLEEGDTETIRQEWPVEDYETIRQLHKAGPTGRVDLMRCIKNGTFVAVKRMPRAWACDGPDEFHARHPTACERPWVDIKIVRTLMEQGFSSLCALRGVYVDALHLYVVSEFATDGDLFQWCLSGPSPGPDRETIIRPLVRQMCEAVSSLHNAGIGHGDVSLENVMLSRDADGALQIKIIDFAMASFVRFSGRASGKRIYQAPEMVTTGLFDVFLADDFSLGVALFSMVVSTYPWSSTRGDECPWTALVLRKGFRKVQLKRQLRCCDGATIAEAVSSDLFSIIEGLLRFSTVDRFCLGETCFMEESDGVNCRESVWNNAWFSVT